MRDLQFELSGNEMMRKKGTLVCVIHASAAESASPRLPWVSALYVEPRTPRTHAYVASADSSFHLCQVHLVAWRCVCPGVTSYAASTKFTAQNLP